VLFQLFVTLLNVHFVGLTHPAILPFIALKQPLRLLKPLQCFLLVAKRLRRIE